MDKIDLKPLIKAGFSYKGIKTWEGMEGPGFQATLYFNGKAVAQVTDDGHGGELRIHWNGLRWDGSIMDFEATRAKGTKATYMRNAKLAQEAKAKLDEIVASTPPVPSKYEEGAVLAVTDDWLLNELGDFMLLAKDCAKKTYFRQPGATDGTYLVINQPYSPQMKAYIEQKYPGATIINEEVNALLAEAP